MNIMKTFLLLLLSLMTVCAAPSKVKGCVNGWVEFTCNYPDKDEQYKRVDMVNPRGRTTGTSKKNDWEIIGNISLFHDTGNKNLKVAIKQLEGEDFGDYKCKFYEESDSDVEEHKVTLTVDDNCQEPLNHTTYKTAKTNITCDYNGHRQETRVKFFCKQNGSVCEEVLSTKPSHTLSMSISNVSSQHAGVYWCGVKSDKGHYRAGLGRIQLAVNDIPILTKSTTIGQNLTYWYQYPKGPYENIFICKGEDPSTCDTLADTLPPNKATPNTGRFFITDSRVNRNITITVVNVKREDTGTYWCGGESINPKKNISFHKLQMTVVCAAPSKVKGCVNGWVEFTCNYPDKDEQYKRVDMVNPRGRTTGTSKKNDWEIIGNISLFHDTGNKNLKVAIKQLEGEDFGDYKCKFYEESDSDVEEHKVTLTVDDNCQEPLNHTTYKTAKTNITCDYNGHRQETRVKFFCKQNGSVCEEVLSTKPSHTLSMSISNVSSQHAGVYWCGVKSDKGHYRAGLGRIQLAVNDIPILTKSTTIGQNLTYWYQYPKGPYENIFICKGEDPSTCDTLADTLPPNKATPNTGRFFITDSRVNRNITITVVNVRREDTGTYWCGGESINPKKNISFHKLQMTVVWSPAGGSWLTVTIPVVICVAVLLLMLVLLCMGFQRKKNTRNGEAQNKEDRPYEEIQELPQKPGSGTALKSIYVTANAPTNPPPSHYYSSISFHKSSGEASGDTYSTVKDNIQCPTYSTVNHPSRLPEDPFYSTVNRPQQH